MRIPSILPILTALAAAAACGENPAQALPAEAVFTYEFRTGSDAAWQTFRAEGRIPSVELGPLREGIEVAVSDPPGRRYAFIEARQQVAPGSWITAGGLVPLLKAGDRVDILAINEICQTGRYCINAGFTLVPAGAAAEFCAFTEGGYVLTRVTEAWLSATFVGRGTCGQGAALRAFEVRGGRLDVPLAPMAG